MRTLLSAVLAALLAIYAPDAGAVLFGGQIVQATPSKFPITQSASKRYLIDAQGNPFLLVADSAQALIRVPLCSGSGAPAAVCTGTDTGYTSTVNVSNYLTTRATQGFNAIQIYILCGPYTNCLASGADVAGNNPFTATLAGCNAVSLGVNALSCYDLATPNAAYWSRIDAIVSLAEQNNLWVILSPDPTDNCVTAGTGTNGSTWFDTYSRNGATKTSNFAQFLGNRYKNNKNVAWQHGNDYSCYQTQASDNIIFSIANGIIAGGDSHLQTMQTGLLNSGQTPASSLDDTTNNWGSVLGFNGVYSYAPIYSAAQGGVRFAYNQTPTLPVYVMETDYEGENNSGIECNGATPPGPQSCQNSLLRKQLWWTLTSGGTGQIFGNKVVWPFNSGWETNLATPGATQFGYAKQFMAPLSWPGLKPDTSNVFLTAGQGSTSTTYGGISANSYATAAISPDGSLGIVYVPLASTVQVTMNLANMGGPVTARWYDPTNNTFAAIAGSPFAASSQAIPLATANSEGTGDKVLLLQGSAVTPSIASTTLSPLTFNTPTSIGATLGALSTTMSPPMQSFSGSYSFQSTGATCSGAPSADNGSFAISGSNVNFAAALGAGTYKICIRASQAGAASVDTAFTVTGTASAVEVPGPSAALFNAPYYSCGTNRYVGNFGAGTPSDSNNGTSTSTPWATIQHANDTIASPSPNTCINVAPGTYSAGAALTKGGNLASSTGYLTYRCATPSFISGGGCIISASDHGFCWGSSCSTTTGPNYIIIDGFILDATTRQASGQGIQLWNGNLNSTSTSAHHIWIINNIFRDYGQSNVQMNDGEYFYVIHNETTQGAYVDCGARGSGISFVLAKAISGYTPTADDTNNSAMGLYGPSFPFKIVANWNVAHINSTTTCGNSDGNGIIADSFHNTDVPFVNYPGQTLVAFNVLYNNGGSGFQAFDSDNVTVANNSAYNNYINTNITGTERSNLDSQTGSGHNFINNISYSITGSGVLANNNAYNIGWAGGSCSSPVCATLTKNLSFCTGKTTTNCAASFNSQPAFSCTNNKCDVNPNWVNVGNTSAGNDTTNPNGTNFALQAGSQAIGYGQTQTYLHPTQAVDAGACYHTLTTCP